MPSASLSASQTGLASVAAQLTAAANSLAAVAAAPPAHAPLAADEVSISSAARLTEHGGVLASRASDGASVLSAAAAAVLATAASLATTDQANASALSLGAGPVTQPPTPSSSPAAVTLNAVAADTGIAPMAPRPGELTAGLIEAGTTSTGASYCSACQAYGGAFAACAVAARTAQAAVSGALTGRTSPRLISALDRFASWADAMATHSDTLATAAQDHSTRFAQTQHQTPKTGEFTQTRQSLARAAALNAQTGGRYSAVVAQLQGQLAQLDSTATAAGISYQLAELPHIPPPAPQVADIVGNGSDQSGGDTTRATPFDSQDSTTTTGGSRDLDASTPIGDALDPAASASADLLGGASATGGDPIQQIAPMAAMIPSMLAGTLGGVIGAVTSIPQQIGQQVMGAAQQMMQSATSAMATDAGLDPAAFDSAGSGDGLGAGDLSSDFGSGGGGGGGETEPAGLDASMPSGGGMLAASSAPASPGPVLPMASGTINPAAAGAATTAAGGMGPMMTPPMMGGMGAAGGTGRAMNPPDKTVVIPPVPNAEPVKGEVERRHTVTTDTAGGKQKADEPTNAGKPRRRVVVPASDTPEEKQ